MQFRQSSHLRCIFFLVSLQFLLLTRAQQNVSCFFPNGVAIADKTSHNDFYTACPTSAGSDGSYMCCKTSSPFNDVCNEDGLCARQNDPSLGDVQGLLRSSCTDPTWTSPSCLKLCITGLDYLGNVANATEQFVKQCDDGSWCCEAQDPPLDQNVLNSTMQSQVDACCSRGSGVFINNGKVTNVNPSGTATSASVTPTTTQSPSSPTRTPPPPPHPHTPTGAIVGGVVGGVAGLVLIVVATFYCRRMKRNSNSMPEDSSGQEMLEAWNLHEKHGNERFETDGTPVVGERNGPYEM